MQIVIDINDNLYTRLFDNGVDNYDDAVDMAKAIRKGIPLPKGHGDLKDADAMVNKLCTHKASELFGSITCAEILDFINDEKTIIKADADKERNDNE